ncbi:hypothetical protein PYW08_010721 [Mythimna loreyi]|uniref:Uncharacterized protein n=1 Tax=Mythimna loreyi TaxID=667449 RepID=A0ACC2Q669_9NEOP|nr:hypothetical protein PYW08_010721 [Mythimna loreyi]
MTDNVISRYTSDIIYHIIYWTLFILPLTAVLYGVTSWCIIKKFRHYRNFVLLSACIADMLYLLVWFFMSYPDKLLIYLPDLSIYIFAIFLCCLLSYNCWLLVLCYIFYVDFVKVFSMDIRRRYLKSCLICWGVPIVTLFLFYVIPVVLNVNGIIDTALPALIAMFLVAVVIIVIIICNFVLYLRVVHSLFRGIEIGASTSTKKWRRFFICTLVFGFSNVLTLTALLQIFEVKDFYIIVLVNFGLFVNTLALTVYTILGKSNREVWREYLNKRRSKQVALQLR